MFSSSFPSKPCSNLPFVMRNHDDRPGLSRPFVPTENQREISGHPNITTNMRCSQSFHGDSITRNGTSEALKPPGPMEQDPMSNTDKFAPPFLFGERQQKKSPKNTRLSPSRVLRTMPSPNKKQEVTITDETEDEHIYPNGPPKRSMTREPIKVLDKIPSRKSSIGDSSVIRLTTSFNSSTFEISESNSKDFWVTIYGFPKEKIHDVLQLFARHGNIVAYKIASCDGNWVHVRYSSLTHVKQALSRHLQVHQGYMIGVVPCTDRELACTDGTSRLNVNTSMVSATSNHSSHDMSLPASQSRQISSVSSWNSDDDLNNHSLLSSPKRVGMRPLNASLVSRSVDVSLDHHKIQPNKADSFIGKLWNFVAH